MASPIGHSLLGLSVALGARPAGTWLWPCLALGVVAANLPDLDFLPGLLIGDANRFHQGPSHSLAAAALFGGLVYLGTRWAGGPAVRLAVVGVLAYGSHLLMDLMTEDKRAPFGIPLFWPASSEHHMATWQIFGGVKHGVPGESLPVVLGQIFSLANLQTIAVELVVLTPVVLVTWLLGRWPLKERQHIDASGARHDRNV